MKCAVHKDRLATQLCLVCQRWYCQQCMQPGFGTSICRSCHARGRMHGTASQQDPAELIRTVMRELQGGLATWLVLVPAVAAGVIGLVAGLAVHPAFFALWAVPLLLFLALRYRPRRRPAAAKGITDAQVLKALQLRGDRITPEELAQLTWSTPEQAAKKLDQMVDKGQIGLIPDDQGNLFYSTRQLSLDDLGEEGWDLPDDEKALTDQPSMEEKATVPAGHKRGGSAT